MSDMASAEKDLRGRIIADPDAVLDDADVMRALFAAKERALGENIVDLRGLMMERLEERLTRLEGTHRSVIAAAYENVSGTNQVHRAVLKLLEPASFEDFLRIIETDLADIFRVDQIRLVLETREQAPEAHPEFDAVLTVLPEGSIVDILTEGREVGIRDVSLRQVETGSVRLYGEAAHRVRSEALLKLDLGEGRLPGLLALGATDPDQFRTNQGTDFLAFFAEAFERALRRWLS